MSTPTLDRETMLRTIQAWPLREQIAFAQEVLELASAPRSGRSQFQQAQTPSWREMAGIAAVPGKEPPTDEQVAQWLDERRMEKYGR